MNPGLLLTEILPLSVQLHPVIKMSDDQFFEFCQLNRDLRIERTASGELLIMPPTGAQTGRRNFSLAVQLGIWAEKDGTGIGFDSSTGFTLPSGAVRSPDVSWIRQERWETISEAARQKFARICPDFVVELRSPTDNLKLLQEKMHEYIDDGAALGWLIDPQQKQVYVYRPQAEVKCLDNPIEVSGDPVLPGFVLDLTKIW